MEELKFNNGTINVKEDGVLSVINITGDCEIIINGEVIYTPHNKKEYRLLPSNLISFVSSHEDFIGDEGDNLDIDLSIDGKTVTIYVPKNKRKKCFSARYDTSEDNYMSVLNDYEIDESLIEEFKISRENMINQLKEMGYKLKYSHSQDEFIWCWSDIEFNIKDFNEDEFIKISRIMIEHDNMIKKLYENL